MNSTSDLTKTATDPKYQWVWIVVIVLLVCSSCAWWYNKWYVPTPFPNPTPYAEHFANHGSDKDPKDKKSCARGDTQSCSL